MPPGTAPFSSNPRRTLVTLLLFALVIGAGVAVILRTQFTADLSAFLPAAPDADQRLLIDQLQQGIAARSLMLGIDGGSAPARASASRELAAVLRASRSFTSVNNGERVDYTAAGKVLLAHRYVLSPAVDAQRFSVEGLNAALADTALRLATPEGAAFKPLWPRDPTGEMLVVAEGLLPTQGPRSEGGVWVSRDGARTLQLLTLRAASGDVQAQADAIGEVQQAFDALRATTPALSALTLAVGGHGVYAMQSRELIEREAKRLSIFGAIGVALVLLVAFGRLSALLLAALPVATGVVAGIAATSLSFGQVHGMTLGFGATLIGESVDYAIYYLIQARPDTKTGTSRWWHDGWPTVRLGLFTSVFGFAALVFSGFPGLAQLGVFSLAGLIAAALATRYVLPVLAPKGTAGLGLRATLAAWTAWAVQHLPKLRWPFVALTVAAIATLALLPKPIWRGDLQALSPVPAQTIATDTRLRADLGASDARTIVVAQGATLDAALAAAEAAAKPLADLAAQGVIAGFESPTRLLPSAATQAARMASLPDASTLSARVAQAVQGLPFRAAQINAFIDDVQAARQRAPLSAAAYVDTPLAPALDALLFQRPGGGWAALLPLQLPETAAGTVHEDPAPKLRAALGGLPGVTVLDVKQSIDGIYAHYMREALWQALLGALAVVVLLAVVLKSPRRLLAVTLPLAMSVVLTLALLAALKVPLGILHLVGMLLVVAVGSNYALFFDHLHHTQQTDRDTLASLLLANITTVLTFGLMAASDIAALAAIGMVVAPGALLALVLSGALIGETQSGLIKTRV